LPGHVLVRGNLLLADVVDEGLSLVHIYRNDLLASWGMCWISGRWRRLRDGWRVKLVDEDTRWYLRASRAKLRQDVRCNIIVSDDVMELEAIELVLELADF
jgi:two-component SAPR family response regulator